MFAQGITIARSESFESEVERVEKQGKFGKSFSYISNKMCREKQDYLLSLLRTVTLEKYNRYNNNNLKMITKREK